MRYFHDNIECDWEIEMENQIQREESKQYGVADAEDRKLLDILKASIIKLEKREK
tara:strand:- start:583 stop:747 length:165 start_codon:yes stop_codon:yes gene_type:complete